MAGAQQLDLFTTRKPATHRCAHIHVHFGVPIVHTVHIIHIHTYICVARVAHIPSLPGMYNEFIRIHAHTYCCTCNVILQKEDRDEEASKS